MEVRVTPADVGSRVVIRWRRPDDQLTDVLGTLEAADEAAFTVRTKNGQVVSIPCDRALAAKTIPPPPPRHRP